MSSKFRGKAKTNAHSQIKSHTALALKTLQNNADAHMQTHITYARACVRTHIPHTHIYTHFIQQLIISHFQSAACKWENNTL